MRRSISTKLGMVVCACHHFSLYNLSGPVDILAAIGVIEYLAENGLCPHPGKLFTALLFIELEVYNSLVLPYLYYCSLIWGCNSLNKLNSIIVL